MSEWLEAEQHADRALEMFERGRWAEAESELRKALSMNPDQAEWHYNLGLTLEASGRDREALACFDSAAELLGDEAEPLLAAGAACNRLGESAKAIGYLDRALKIDAKLEPAYAQKIDAEVRLGRAEEAETTFFLSQQMLSEPSGLCYAAVAESLIAREQWQRAEWCLRQAMRLEPSLPRMRARLAYVLGATGRRERALQLYVRDLREDPGSIDTLLDYGELLVELGRGPEAAEKFRRVLEIEPANVDAHLLLGRQAMNAGRHEQAHVEFELVMKLDPGCPGIRLQIAEALIAMSRVAEATEHVRCELDSFKESARVSRDPSEDERLGDALIACGMADAAAGVLRATIDEHGESVARLRRLALAVFSTGDTDGGAAISRRVLRLDHECCASIHNLALAALEQGRLKEATGWLRRGLKVDADDEALRRLRVRIFWEWIKHLSSMGVITLQRRWNAARARGRRRETPRSDSQD